MNTIGLTLAEFPENASRRVLSRLLSQAIEFTPPGRIFAGIYPLPQRWKVSVPVESFVVTRLLGAPQARSEESEWEFFANLAVRVCEAGRPERSVVKEIGVILMRRAGDKAYVRRHSLPDTVLSRSVLPTLHPVFTRDVANNVWHIPDNNFEARIRTRLGGLLAWPDEDLLLIGEARNERIRNGGFGLDQDLVGVPTKVSYSFD